MRLLEIFGSATPRKRIMVFAIAVLLAYPHPVVAQSVGPSGCVANCGTGGGGYSGGGGGYNPYAGMAAGALGAFMQGFMNELQRANDPRNRSITLNNQGVDAENRGYNLQAISLYEEALRLDPNNHVARKNLSNTLHNHGYDLYEQKDYEAAAIYYRQSLAYNPNSDLTRRNLRYAEKEAQAVRHVNEAGVRVRDRFKNLADELNTPAPPSSSLATLDFKEPEPLIQPSSTLDRPEMASVAPSNVPPQLIQSKSPLPNDQKATSVETAMSTAALLVSKKNYAAALRYLKEAKLNNPDQPGIDETIAFVRGMKASGSPELLVRLEKSPSPKAEIILDALTVGDGNWESSIRYLEGMKQKDPDDPHVREALNYTRGMYHYQITKELRTLPPKEEEPLFYPDPDQLTDEEMLKQIRTLPPKEEEPLFYSKIPPKVDQSLLGWFESPEGRAVERHLMDQEVNRIIKGIDEKYIITKSSEGLDAIGRKDFATAHKIFSSLHQEYPDHINLRDAANYVEGLYDAQRKSR